MLYAIHCLDKPGLAAVRAENRPAHLAYLEENAARVRLAGPYLADDGEAMTGSLLVVEAENIEEARAFAAADPYARAGLFASVEIRPWRWAVGRPGA